MTLIKSISGIRGTIGGVSGEALTPMDIAKYTAAYATFIDRTTTLPYRSIVVGHDARISGPMVIDIVVGTLMGMGFDVINIGLASTPTTELAVTYEEACGGLILTASHNPKNWNALKLLNEKGEFLSAAEGQEVLRIANSKDYVFADVDHLGHHLKNTTYNRRHIQKVLALPLVDIEAIRKANFSVAVDAVNSVGGVVIPELLRALGVQNVIELNCDPTGNFAHNPEPIPENLSEISKVVKDNHCDVGFVVDPDVDRLAIVMENGEMFVEEYTLVAIADYVLSSTPGPAVSNLSSSRALSDIASKHRCPYVASAVGEVNVTTLMKHIRAVIGGEGNGGVIYPALHSGRDAMVGVALFLSNLAHKKLTVSELKKTYPQYAIAKNRIDLSDTAMIDRILNEIKKIYADENINDIDGVKISFEQQREWVHLRKSNTEPIIRIYAEAATLERADALAGSIIEIAKRIIG